MIYKVVGEQPFQVLSDNFTISPAAEAYILQVSANGENYSDLFTVAAGVTRMITGVAAGSFYRLKNNVGEVSVNWRKSCGGGGGEGDAYALKPSASLPLFAEEGTLMAASDGIYQFLGGAWVEAGGSIDEDEVRKIVKEEIEPLEERVEDLEEKVEDIDKRIDEVEEVTSIALNDLNTRVNEKTTEKWVKDQEYLTEPDLKTVNGESLVGTGDIFVQSQSFILEIEEKLVSTDVYVYEMTDAVEQADNLNKYFVKNGETASVIVKFTDKSGEITVFDVDKRDVDINNKLACHFYTEKLYIEILGNGDIDAETGHLSKVTSVDVDIKEQSKHLVEEDLKTVNGESLVGTGDIFVPDNVFAFKMEELPEGNKYVFPDDVKQADAAHKYLMKNGLDAPINIAYKEKNSVDFELITPYERFTKDDTQLELTFYIEVLNLIIDIVGEGTEFDTEGHLVKVESVNISYTDLEKHLVESDLKTLNGESLVGTGNIEIVIPLAKDDYDALPEEDKKKENVAYFVQDDDDAVEVLFTDKLIEGMKDKLSKIMLDSLYPVGSYSFGVKPNIGTWEEVVGDRALWLKNTADDGTEIEQALPNITGTIAAYTYNTGSPTGAFTVQSTNPKQAPAGGDTDRNFVRYSLDASRSSSIYKNGANVQPNAYVIKVYKRIA